MKEKLTLPKKPKKVKNFFKCLKITELGQRTIGIAQSDFENFWGNIGKIDMNPQEKQMCLIKLQEACSVFCRGIAKYHEIKDELKED